MYEKRTNIILDRIIYNKIQLDNIWLSHVKSSNRIKEYYTDQNLWKETKTLIKKKKQKPKKEKPNPFKGLGRGSSSRGPWKI